MNSFAMIVGYIVMVAGSIVVLCLIYYGFTIMFGWIADRYLRFTETGELFVEFVREQREKKWSKPPRHPRIKEDTENGRTEVSD